MKTFNDIRIRVMPIVLALMSLTATLFANKVIEKTVAEKGVDAITVQITKEHVEFLADDKMEGRKVGSAGALKTADYIASCLKDIGITDRKSTRLNSSH